MLYRSLFRLVKRIVPKVSETELVALRSGTTSIDRQIFEGKVELPPTINNSYQGVSKKDITSEFNKNSEFFNNKVDDLLTKYGDEQVYPNPRCDEIFDYLGKNKFYSLIIDKEYGGTKLPIKTISNILTKISSKNPSLGVVVMVPNSLGPGELLSHYGTQQQKDKYLPKLATGEYIPCFGLTGPHNGSDATGTIDEGTLVYRNGKRVIDIEIDKRYITLSPVSNLIGLAFRLNDPDNLLEIGNPGVTVALLEKGHLGLRQDTYLNPLNAGFPNGTLKGKFEIELDDIIGGEENAGEGWKMLMECLATGRAISLPSTANASSKTATFGTYLYAKHRIQFNMPLIKMQAIQNKIVDMVFHTWVIQSSIEMTNYILDSGERPAVISAIMKQQTTDRAREVLNQAMDILAGSAICLGENNFLEKFYSANPIGITVEGSNTLTRNLIIFGQGLNKSHPYIYPLLDSVLNDNLVGFKTEFKNMVSHFMKMYKKSLKVLLPSMPSMSSLSIPSIFNRDDRKNKRTKILQQLENQTIHFANLSNFVALLGGKIKKEQSMSADMADILSNLYFGHCIEWYYGLNSSSEILTNYCIQRLCYENQIMLNRIIDNYPGLLRYLLLPMKKKIKSFSYYDKKDIISVLEHNPKILDTIKENIYMGDTILNKFEKLEILKEMENNYNPNNPNNPNNPIDLLNIQNDYTKLYNNVISVGEYPIQQNNQSTQALTQSSPQSSPSK